jgi:hypothetical protein
MKITVLKGNKKRTLKYQWCFFAECFVYEVISWGQGASLFHYTSLLVVDNNLYSYYVNYSVFIEALQVSYLFSWFGLFCAVNIAAFVVGTVVHCFESTQLLSLI